MTKIISETSKNYAKALIEKATEQNCLDLYSKQLKDISETLASSEDLRVVMANSSISTNKKNDILEAIFSGKIDKKLLNFLKILVDKNRFSEFEAIRQSFTEMLNKQSNKKNVEIVSAVKLNFENRSNVLFKLEHKLKSEITPTWSVDKKLIAGLVFKFDDCVIDTSIRAKLDNLNKMLRR